MTNDRHLRIALAEGKCVTDARDRIIKWWETNFMEYVGNGWYFVDSFRFGENSRIVPDPSLPTIDSMDSQKEKPQPLTYEQALAAKRVQLQRVIELEADNKRLREVIAEAEAHLSIHVCKNEDNQEIVAAHLLDCAMNHSTPTTGLLDLAVAGYLYARNKPDEEYDAVESFGRYTAIYRKIEALSPETRQLLEDMA